MYLEHLYHALLLSDVFALEFVAPSCVSMSTAILSSVISVVITALLATLIFVLLQLALYRYHHGKTTTQEVEPSVSARGDGGEQQAVVYEQVEGVGGAAVSDPTYMEVGAEDGEMQKCRNAMELKENEAYGCYNH